jgi:hypothetical protein
MLRVLHIATGWVRVGCTRVISPACKSRRPRLVRAIDRSRDRDRTVEPFLMAPTVGPEKASGLDRVARVGDDPTMAREDLDIDLDVDLGVNLTPVVVALEEVVVARW